jgi:peptide/nickel transport system substrate-binding protein
VKKLWVSLTILLVLTFLIAGCSSPSPPTTTPIITPVPTSTTPTPVTTTKKPVVATPTGSNKYGGLIRWIDPAVPVTAMGWNAEATSASVFSMQLCLQTLLKEQADGKIIPGLAESYEVVTNSESPSITFHLRKDIKFLDGSDFNAEAAKWNLEKIKAGGLNANVTNLWNSFDIIDDYTVRVNLAAWSNRQIREFAGSIAYMVSPSAYEQNGLEWMRWNMVGTGAFLQKKFVKDVRLDVVRNPDYYVQGKPYLDGIQVLYVPDERIRIALYKSGGAEILTLGDSPGYAADLAKEGFKILSQPTGATVLVPDSGNADSPWSNPQVRLAMEYALDKEAIGAKFGHGYYTPAYQLSRPTSMAYAAVLPARQYDISKAEQLLSEAGYPHGFQTQIIVPAGFNMDIAADVQYYLDAVGIQAEIAIEDPATLTKPKGDTLENYLVIKPSAEWINPNTGFNSFWETSGFGFKNLSKPAGWDEAFAASDTSLDPNSELVQKLETLAYNDAMVTPLYYGVFLWAMTGNIEDSGIGTRGMATWFEPQNTWLSK